MEKLLKLAADILAFPELLRRLLSPFREEFFRDLDDAFAGNSLRRLLLLPFLPRIVHVSFLFASFVDLFNRLKFLRSMLRDVLLLLN